MTDGEYSTLTKLGLGALTIINSTLAIYRSWGDAGSVAFVLAADAALLLLFLCLRELEKVGGRGTDGKIKVLVWLLTTVLTSMFLSRVTPMMPLAVGILVFICLRDVDHVGINMDRQYCALGKVGFAVLTCNLALDDYATGRDDPVSAALVFVSYAVFLILTLLFVCAFARAHAV